MSFLEYIGADIQSVFGQFTMIGARFSRLFLLSAILIALIFYRRDISE